MVSLTKALAVARTTRNAFNYWRSAGHLQTDFSETKPGVARDLSRNNVLEITLMATLTGMGHTPKEAKELIYIWLNYRLGEFPPYMARRHDEAHWLTFEDMNLNELAHHLGALIVPSTIDDDPRYMEYAAVSFSVINFKEIKRRVDELFIDQNEGNN